MVIVAEDGMKALKKKSEEMKDLIGTTFIAAKGCSNTENLIFNLMKSYVALVELEKSIKQL